MVVCPLCDGTKLFSARGFLLVDRSSRVSQTACGLCRETGKVSAELDVLVRLASDRQLREIRHLCKWSRCDSCYGTGRLNQAGDLPCAACNGKGRRTRYHDIEEIFDLFK